MKKLAIYSGKPAFDCPLCVGAPVVEPGMSERYQTMMAKVFERQYFTNDGPLVQNLEKEIATIHGVKYCSALCNGTIAQILLLKALGLKGELILPSFTFIATAHACLWQNLKPVFCDIRDDTLMIDVEKAEKLITSETSAIIGVNLYGNVCDTQGLENLCKRHDLKLVFDSAHAFCCSRGDTMVGNNGHGEFISLHATKFFATFEGGVVLTNNSEIDAEIRLLRNFGFRDYDDVASLGINGKMSESSAAMGLASLPFIEQRIAYFNRVRESYCRYLSGIDGISVLPVGQQGRSNFQYMVILVEEADFGVSRDELCDTLWKENILTRKYFFPGCHSVEPYGTRFPEASRHLPVTNSIVQKVLCLPMNLGDPEGDVQKIVSIIAYVGQNAEKVRACLKSIQQK